MIRMTGINKSYVTGDIETLALNDVELAIERGEFVAIMGPSGCGKSTLLNVLGLTDAASGGHHYFDGVEVTAKSERELAGLRKRNIGFVFQSFNLIDDLSVFENVELPLLYLGMPKDERARRTKEMLEKIGLTHRANHRPNQLSGGQQQRVAVSRALVAQPKLILADEPTGNLDTKNGAEIMSILKDLGRAGVTVVMVTHSPAEARHADRIVNMVDGRVVARNSATQPS